MEQKKIIVVDDVDLHLLTTKSRLKEHYEIYPAKSGKIMFEILENIKPDLILLDINMPDMDGFEIIKLLKAQACHEDIPVIFFTAQNDINTIKKALNHGAVDFVAKPYKDSTLIERIERQLITESNAPLKKVIVVDDTDLHLLSTKNRLRRFYEVYPAKSAEMLFEILRHVMPEVILLDINMPDVDGFKTITELKSRPEYADIPVIFLTSHNDVVNIRKAITLGAADFVPKPYNDSLLLGCIEKQISPEKKKANRPHILAVDDSPAILQEINHVLSPDYEVFTLPNPQQLEELLHRVAPDLFLLDCHMPEMSGYDLIPIIRKNMFFEDTPIVFLTVDGTRDNLSTAVASGVRDIIVKPIDAKILRDKVNLHTWEHIITRRMQLM